MKPTKVYYSENFEIYAFKHKTYGMEGLIEENETYAEAYAAAEKLVLKQCMEENPHLAFQNNKFDKEWNAPAQNVVVNGIQKTFHSFTVPPEPPNHSNNELIAMQEEEPKIGKGTIEEQIEACTELSNDQVKGIYSFKMYVDMNKKYKPFYEKKLADLQKQTV